LLIYFLLSLFPNLTLLQRISIAMAVENAFNALNKARFDENKW
jgi:hypothetical protein